MHGTPLGNRGSQPRGPPIFSIGPAVAALIKFQRLQTMDLLLYLSPLWIVFEAWQLFVAERYLGIKQIEQGVDPRSRGPREPVAFTWSAGIFLYWSWMILMLIPESARIQIVCMLGVSLLGYSLRRNSPLKWILVILTLEGAVRIGMIVSILGEAWSKL